MEYVRRPTKIRNIGRLMIYILLHLILKHATTVSSELIIGDCSKLLNNMSNQSCSCYPILTSLEVNCPAAKPQILMRIKPGSYAQMECKNLKHYNHLPSMFLGNLITMNIRDCPLPVNYTIARILQQMGVKKLNTLILELDDSVKNLTSQHFVHLKRLKNLNLKTSNSTLIPADLFHHAELQQLTNLTLYGQEKELPEGVFNNLENLHSLMLTNFKTLPNGIFRKLCILTKLRIIGNQLYRLTKDLFKNLSKLNQLDLINTKIKIVEPGSFGTLANLQHVNFMGNSFNQLPENLFENNKHLTKVSLRYCANNMKSLPENLLANKPQLKVVRVNCNVKLIAGSVFSNSESLTNVNLAFNKLKILPDILFKTMYNLVDLDLSHNHLIELPHNIFEKNIRLTKLNLSFNNLEKINSIVFSTLTKLEILDISHNHLLNINMRAFTNNHNLRGLYLNNNNLTLENRLPETWQYDVAEDTASPFLELNKLQILDLSKNSIRHIHQDLKLEMPELQRLNLSHNNISTVDFNDFYRIKKYDLHIDLRNNHLKRLTFDNIQHISRVETKQKLFMNLNENSVPCDCFLVDFIKFLRKEFFKNTSEVNTYMELNVNALKCAEPENLKGKLVKDVDPNLLLCPLKTENVNNRSCPAKCKCWVRSYDFTLIVNCTAAHLTQVPPLPLAKTFRLTQTELYLDNNRVNILPKNHIAGYSDVTKLSLSDNNLTRIEYNNLPPGINYLDIRRNNLVSLNISNLTIWNKVKSLPIFVYLSENPWICDCASKPLLEMVQKNYRLIKDLDNITCLHQNEIKRYFKELTVMDLCHADYTLMIIIIILLIGCLIMSVIVALYLKYEHEIKVWMYAHKLCMGFITEDDLDKDKKYDAFISYSCKDVEFVAKDLVPELERGSPPYKLCINKREFDIGAPKAEEIVNAIENSRRTIVVLSSNFIESGWKRFEFGAAHKEALDKRRNHVIAIIYGDLDTRNLDNELRAYLKTSISLKWDLGSRKFWHKLRYAMPHHCDANTKT